MPIIESSVSTAPAPSLFDKDLFNRIAKQIRSNFRESLNKYTGPIFTSGPARRKQSHITSAYKKAVAEHFGATAAAELDCATCKNFLHFIGGLRGIDQFGDPVDLLWDPAYVTDQELIPFFTTMHAFVQTQRTRAPLIVGKDNTHISAIMFQCTVSGDDIRFGHAHLGGFAHFTLDMTSRNILVVDSWNDVDVIQNKLAQSYEQVLVTLKEKGFTAGRIHEVSQILRSDLCDREEFIGKVGLPWWNDLVVAVWTRKEWRDTILLKMCEKKHTFPYATFALHSSSVWSIFDKLQEGWSASKAGNMFKGMTRSDKYMRSTTEATSASIDRAEKLIEEMGLTSALQRRGASMEDLLPYLIWKSSPVEVSDAGVTETARPLDVLRKPKILTGDELPSDLSSVIRLSKVMTWVKFKSQVLPTVKQMWVKFAHEPVGILTMMTQVDPEAKPLMVWDKEDNRCPISWYTYVNGQPMSTYGGNISSVYRVTGIMPNPACRPSLPELSRLSIGSPGDFLLLEGLEDSKFSIGGVRLFPEIIRRDLQTDAGIRRVIEQYSNSAEPDLSVTAVVATAAVHADAWRPVIIVKTLSGATESYVVDRLD